MMEQVNSRPSGYPLYAGRALTLQTNLNRITWIKKMFDKAEWMPDSTSSIPVKRTYKFVKEFYGTGTMKKQILF